MTRPPAVSADFRLLEPFWRESVIRTILPNGLTLILKPDRSAALASVEVWVKTGSIHEGGWLGAGVSHYLEHMLFKGTTRRSGREISSSAQAHGANLNAYTTFDRTVYFMDLPSEHMEFAVDLLADAVLHSTLPADEAAKEREVILREIAMTQDDPDDRLWEAVFASAFREHPYRHPVIGYRDVFSAVAPAALAAYHRARYVPNNLVVVIVGDIDPAAAQAAVTRHFGAVPRAALEPVWVPAEPAQLAPREQHRFEDVELSRAVLAWQIPGLTHADSPVLDLLATALGHGDSSVLWQELREKAGLVHTVDASTWNPGSSGLFCAAFTCEPEKRAAATAALESILARAAGKGFPQAALQKAIRQLVVGEINGRKTMSGQAARLGAAEVSVGDLNYSRTYFERLRAVTPADLRRAIRTYLIPSGRTSVSINPISAEVGLGCRSQPFAPDNPKRSGTSLKRLRRERPGTASRPYLQIEARPAGVPDFTQTVLPNGARLLVQINRRLPNLQFTFLMQGGPLFEDPGKCGATALLATLLTKDTRRRSSAAVARLIEDAGGSFHPVSGNNSLGFAAEVLPPDAGRALVFIAGAALEPAFKPAVFETERDAQLAGLRQDADDVVTFARKLVRRKFFAAHPLALDAQGDEAGVKALAVGDLADLYRRLCVGPNAVLAVAGDVPPALEARLKAFLSKLPREGHGRGGPPRPRQSAFLPAAPADLVEYQPREQSVVLQAFPGPRLHAPDYHVGEVADELFSGMASRLFERVREEKALAYFVRSARVSGLDAGMFSFFAGTQAGKEAEVLGEIEAEIARVQAGGIEAAELLRCQTRLKAGRRQSLQTNAACAFQAALNALQGQPVNAWKDYDARIDAVGLEDLKLFATKYFQRSSRTQLVVSAKP